MDKSLISIIVTIYNVEKYLDECIQSVINQTYKNLEIILIDDGSTDRCDEICKIYSEKDNRIKLIKQTNQGVSVARNKGIKASTGKYIMFVDGDDWIDLDCCEIAIQYMENKDCDIVMWSYIREFKHASLPKKIFDSDIFFNEVECEKLHRRLFGLVNEELNNPESADSLAPVCMKLYKSELIHKNEIEFYDIDRIGTYEDGLFNIHVFNYVKNVVFLNKCLYHYRKTNEISITTKYKENLVEQWLNLFSIMDNYIKEYELSYGYVRALENRISLAILDLGLNIICSEKGIIWKIKEIKRVLSIPTMENALEKLSMKYFPIHWKMFYYFSKYKFSIGIYILLIVINNIRKRNNGKKR